MQRSHRAHCARSGVGKNSVVCRRELVVFRRNYVVFADSAVDVTFVVELMKSLIRNSIISDFEAF